MRSRAEAKGALRAHPLQSPRQENPAPSSSTAPSRPGADDGDQIGQATYLTSKQNYEVLIAPGYNPPGRIKQGGRQMGQVFMTAFNTLTRDFTR